ncbi:AraC family transcriptional regulator [Pseudoduganella ginsengisoli]|nr:GyrI-like domain-containing protein [Pseudoduganella ginsengisoli]
MNQDTLPDDAHMRASRAEYARRMNRVLDHIDRHLDAPSDLATLADVANLSRYHFHRLFSAWMGETVGDYTRRVRLQRAAQMLARGSGESVLAVALATGFSSGEAFARAFKLQFGCTPSAWTAATPQRIAADLARLKSNPGQAHRNPDQDWTALLREYEGSPISLMEFAMQVTIETLPPAHVAYQRKIGPYGPQITQFWSSTVQPWMQSHGLMAADCYGVAHDDPAITPAGKCRYDACVAVPEGFQPGAHASLATLPGGRYAVAKFKGRPDTIAAAWMWLMREWLPSSGLQCDERPCFERFSASTAMDAVTGEFSCDICIPVRAL